MLNQTATLRDADGGFALIEIMIALVVLAVAILGVAGSTGGIAVRASNAEVRAEALQAVDDQITRVSMDPRYGLIDSLYAGTDSLPHMPGYRRVTTVDSVEVDLSGDNSATYRRVTVAVQGPGLLNGLARTIVLGAP